MNWTILSSCGTSLLTNGSEKNLENLIKSKSNEKRREHIAQGDLLSIEKRIEEVANFVKSVSKDKIVKASAELNAIVKLYGERGRTWGEKQDLHWLVCTDTWLGEVAALLVKSWLEKEGFIVQVHRQPDLQTQKINEFQLALSDLTKWCYENLPEPQNRRTKVVFNLTGGFKSVNGFLQTLGMFRADETIYIFEGEKKLLSIPRLPIGLTSKELVRQNITAFRCLSLGLAVENITGIPETLILRIDDQTTLSAWGEIQWNEFKREIYSEQVFPPPDEIVGFSKSLEKAFGSYSHKYREINEQVDLLTKYLTSNRQGHTNNLGFEKVKNADNRYEFKAWDDEGGNRFFGHYEGGKFVIDSLGRGLH